jgi:hypothetical protein
LRLSLSAPGRSALLWSLRSKQASGSVISGYGDWSLDFFCRGKKEKEADAMGYFNFSGGLSTALAEVAAIRSVVGFFRAW